MGERAWSPAELSAYRIDTKKTATVEIDSLDDLAIGGDHVAMVRIERMANDHFWGAIYLRDGRTVRLSFWATKRKLFVGVEEEAS